MSVADYLNKADHVVGLSTEIERVSNGLAAAKRHASFQDFVQGVNDAKPKYVPYGATTLAGAAAGGYFIPKHRVLGIIGGASLGSNVPALLNPLTRGMAARNLLETGGGIAGSVVLGGGKRDSVLWKVLGYVAGHVAGSLVSHVGGLE